MRFINLEKVVQKQKISSKTVKKILASATFSNIVSVDHELLCKKDQHLLLNDITIYEETGDKKQVYIVKNNNITELICFNQQTNHIHGRTLKQKLADISTSYLISQFNDATFMKFFKYFYVPLDLLISSYAKMKNLRIPHDICLYYKGGNLFKILLTDITRLFESKEYTNLLKRSDADFQLYINPALDDQVYNDMTVLVLYALLLFKGAITKYGIFDFFKIDKTRLIKLYVEEFKNAGVEIEKIELVETDCARKDFSIQPTTYNGDNVILLKEHKKILVNLPDIRTSKEFYISRNTALDFVRKDNLRSVFDLIRMKRNIKLNVKIAGHNQTTICVPCEIIDVSIPKRSDASIIDMAKHVGDYIKRYSIKDFSFWAPNINYMVKDLDDLLFKQNDYPWVDSKIDKRMIRYFLSLLFHNIMVGIMNREDIVMRLDSFKKELQSIIRFMICYNEKTCDEDNISRIFMSKYIKISRKISTKGDLVLFAEFNNKIVFILKDLVHEIDVLISNMGKVNKLKLQNMYKKLVRDHHVSVIGGSITSTHLPRRNSLKESN